MERCAPAARAELKWPNDVYVDGRKIAGVLLELVGGEAPTVCLGVGVNIVSAPADLERATVRLADLAQNPPTIDEALDALDASLAALLGVWRRDGFAPIRDAWTERAYGLGAAARIVGPGETIEGTLVGLDEDGALLLERPEGRARVVAGSLRFT